MQKLTKIEKIRKLLTLPRSYCLTGELLRIWFYDPRIYIGSLTPY